MYTEKQQQKSTKNSKTDFIVLTELWQQHDYLLVGQTINQEKWSPARVAKFCTYMCRYLGVDQLNLLYKFL